MAQKCQLVCKPDHFPICNNANLLWPLHMHHHLIKVSDCRDNTYTQVANYPVSTLQYNIKSSIKYMLQNDQKQVNIITFMKAAFIAGLDQRC